MVGPNAGPCAIHNLLYLCMSSRNDHLDTLLEEQNVVSGECWDYPYGW
jgi:hypothetical protein